MMWILPILCWFFGLLFLLRKGVEWRTSFLLTAVIWGCLLTVFTELLGLFYLLTFAGLTSCWAVTSIFVVMLNFHLKKTWAAWPFSRLSAIETVFVGGIVLICLATFITAIVVPPNNWDSMTYHMSRVMHWLQNRSVDHYPTHILRQIELNPWAEFAITHFQALSGGDRFANLVQWFSMVGSLIGVSLIAVHLGGNRRAQIVSATVAATIPIGILESSSTQNDYVVAFWLVCMTWAGLKFMKDKDLKWAFVVGASLGLAVLTKGTSYLYALPFSVWIAFAVLRSSPRYVGLAVLLIVAPFFLLNVSHFQRNLKTFSNPLGSGEIIYHVDNPSGKTIVSNILRNTAMQLSTPYAGFNKLIQDGVWKIHTILSIDIYDSRTTWPGTKFKVNKLSRNEDLSVNFLHVIIYATVLVVTGISLLYRKANKLILIYSAAVVSGFSLFCLLLKWQPWHSRLLLPLFVLGAPVAGVTLVKSWKHVLTTLTALTLLIAALPWAFSNATRPLVSISEDNGIKFPLLTVDRNTLYFVNRAGLSQRYMQIANEIRQRNFTNIGLIFRTEETWEYPLWVLIKEGNPAPIRIEHIEVDNISRLIPTDEFRPDIYVRLD